MVLKSKNPIFMGIISDIMERIKGIVLRQIKYNDNAIIVDLFTKQRGRMPIIIKKVRNISKKKSSSNARTIMPLGLIEFDCDVHGQGKIVSPHTLYNYYFFHDIPFNPIKSTIVMFVAEFLTNVLTEEGPNDLLFEYIEDSIKLLDCADKTFMNFHIVFLSRLTIFTGIRPNIDNFAINSYFDMVAGEFKILKPNHPHYLVPDEARAIPYILRMDISNMHIYKLRREQRKRILEILIEYYRIHLSGFKELKSLDVLKEVFD